MKTKKKTKRQKAFRALQKIADKYGLILSIDESIEYFYFIVLSEKKEQKK